MSLRLRKSKNAGACINTRSADRVGRPGALKAAGSSDIGVLAMSDWPEVIYLVMLLGPFCNLQLRYNRDVRQASLLAYRTRAEYTACLFYLQMVRTRPARSTLAARVVGVDGCGTNEPGL